MRQILIWILTAILFAAIGGLCVWTIVAREEEGEHESEQQAEALNSAEATSPVTHDEAGNVVIRFDREMQERVGLETAPLRAADHQPELSAYGVLEQDPARSFTLRPPLPGTLQVAADAPWPRLGDSLKDDAVVGMIEPRLGPVEQADLAARLATAQADVEEAQASLDALQASYESKRKLHEENKIVSDQALQEAESSVKGEEARLKAAETTVHILESYRSTTTQPSGGIPLTVRFGGRVVEVLAQPGEAVDSGQALLRVARFDRLVAKVSLPAGRIPAKKISIARIEVIGHEHEPILAERLTDGPQADPVTGGQSFLFAVPQSPLDLQPGITITARLQLPGAPREGVSVPRSAVVRFAGQAWAYVRTGEEKFTRRQVAVDVPTPDGWFVTEGFQPGDTVVVRGAQSLLSEELESVTAGGGEEEED